MRYIVVLVLVLLFACSPRIQVTVPPSTSTPPGGPTLGPAGVPSPNDSPAATAATAPLTPAQQVSGVATDVLNVRAGPGLDYAVKGQLKDGDAITIIGKSADGLWWQFSGGWVSATYVKIGQDTSAVPVTTPAP